MSYDYELNAYARNPSHSKNGGTPILSYQTATTVSGIEVRLYADMLNRMLRKHGELKNMESKILETVIPPDLVLGGHENELLALKHYEKTPFGAKHIVVVYSENKHLIITAFLTSEPSRLLKKRRIVWRKQT